MNKGFEPDKRFPQANREAWITLGLYGVYFVWWYLCAYVLGEGDPEAYTYVFGLPAWFFYSCVLGYPVLTLLLWVVVRFCFKDMPLAADPDALAPDALDPDALGPDAAHFDALGSSKQGGNVKTGPDKGRTVLGERQ